MGLLEQAKAKWQGLLDYIDANTPRHAGALPTVGRVVDQGLINPNRFNKPSADRFKESTFGLLGIVPGVGDYASVVESADLFNRGEKFAGGMAALGALPLVPAIGGMFIGKGAKTWDVLKAQQAEELLKQGIDPREVWKQTGTMRGVDGALRQEIPDNAAKLNKAVMYEDGGQLNHLVATEHGAGVRFDDLSQFEQKELVAKHGQPLKGYGKVSEILPHAKLYDNYAGLGDESATVAIRPGLPYNGSYSAKGIDMNATNEADMSQGLLHELQHAIQQREGWARGGSPDKLAMELQAEADLMRNKAKSLFDLSSANDPLDPGRIVKPGARKKGLELERQAQKLSSEANRINEFAGLDHDAYRRLAGEAEARLTQARMNMTMPERLQSYPYDMLDVPQDQLIVRGLLGEDMGPAMHTVYHGSPHKFNKFDMSKIGTGEGVQAYGHGLYFAESPAVAKKYADAVEMDLRGKYLGKPLQGNDDASRFAQIALDNSYGDVATAAKYAERMSPNAITDEARQAWLDASKKINELPKFDNAGNLYKVDIPDEAIPRMLDWDKPLSEQAAIHEQLSPVVEKVYGAGSADYILGRSSATAKTVLDDARRVLGDSGMAESAMKQAGIPGIRYLDGSSRGAGQGTSNFVLFDDQLPRILEVNGQPTGLLSYADEAAQGGGLLGKVDNAGMSAWKQNDVFGNGKQIEHLSPDGKSAVVQQTLPNGKTVFYPADVDATYGWVRPDMYKRFDSFEAAQKSIKGMRISDAAKKRNTELYGNIPNTWKGDAKKVAKKLIDNGFDVSRFSSSTQSKSKYIELADGRKIRLSDHDLPSSYEGADFDFRYGGDISELIGKLK